MSSSSSSDPARQSAATDVESKRLGGLGRIVIASSARASPRTATKFKRSGGRTKAEPTASRRIARRRRAAVAAGTTPDVPTDVPTDVPAPVANEDALAC